MPGGNPAWWWYVGVDANAVSTALQQHGARPVNLKQWWTYEGDRFAVVMVNNSGGSDTPANPPGGRGTPPGDGAPSPGTGTGRLTFWMDQDLGRIAVKVNNDRVGSGANIAAGGTANTGYSQTEVRQKGGYVLYPCPYGHNPVDASGRAIENGGRPQQYSCRPQ